MLFTTWTFVIFLIAVFGFYYTPGLQKYQVPILVLASFIFYAWSMPGLLILLLTSVAINTVVSYNVAYTESHKNQKKWALYGVIINLAIIGFFKYCGLLTHLSQDLLKLGDSDALRFLLHIPLPIGISFYTFEGISLLADVQKKRLKNEDLSSIVSRNKVTHFINTALFVTFFPHLIAGPILKANHFYPQIEVKKLKDIQWEYIFRTLVIGFFLKMVLADNLKDQTWWIGDPFYSTLSTITGSFLLFGYSMQIYADFAGYSLIAIGLGSLFGYELAQNFNFPYIARSIGEFWRRWHISLSTWLRDYLYYPLGGNRKGPIRTYINLALVMILGGMWHGAAWSYAVWGAYHGIGLAIERLISGEKEPKKRSPFASFIVDSLNVTWVFTFVTLGWLLFKLPNFEHVMAFLGYMKSNTSLGMDFSKIGPVVLFSFPVLVFHAINTDNMKQRRIEWDSKYPKATSLVKLITFCIMLTLIVLNYGDSNEFIYFQF